MGNFLVKLNSDTATDFCLLKKSLRSMHDQIFVATRDGWIVAREIDPAGLPLSPGVRFTENTAEIKIGDGLWVSASEAPTTFKIYAVDPATSQVAIP